MKQSRSLHVALIMDGNGRWATGRGLPRPAGHRTGALALERIVLAAAPMGIATLTAYAFSSDNWRRPANEVFSLMHLFGVSLHRLTDRCVAHGIQLSVLGRRDRLGARLQEAIGRAEAATSGESRIHLRLAIDYSSRHTIETALACGERPSLEPAVDLLIRTGGEQRLSDFLLWECAYAELYFTPTLWPDFRPDHLGEAVAWFESRERRFGALPAA